MLITIFVITCLGKLGKIQAISRGFLLFLETRINPPTQDFILNPLLMVALLILRIKSAVNKKTLFEVSLGSNHYASSVKRGMF